MSGVIIKVKDNTVQFKQFKPCFFMVCDAIRTAWGSRAPGVAPVITSGNDSKHMPNSRHYTDEGWDFRTNNLPTSTLDLIVKDLRNLLGIAFDVVREKDHLHIEFDPD